MKKYEVRNMYADRLSKEMTYDELMGLIGREASAACPTRPIINEWTDGDWTFYDTSLNVWKVREI